MCARLNSKRPFTDQLFTIQLLYRVHVAPNFCEIAKNYMNVNFRDKNFVIGKFFS